MAGNIPLILIDPAYQRRGIGTGLLATAVERLHAGGAVCVTAASGGGSYIWPGVPRDLPAAIRFFASRGWRHSHDTLDLVTDLACYRPPPGVFERAADAGVSMRRAASADMASVLAFEAAAFPSWVRWFRAADRVILIARDRPGAIAGTLLFRGPGADTVFAPMFGPAAGAIGCAGVAPRVQGHGIGTALVARASEILREAGTRTCHIGWTTRESFYRRAGYQPWRRYAMFSRPAWPGPAGHIRHSRNDRRFLRSPSAAHPGSGTRVSATALGRSPRTSAAHWRAGTWASAKATIMASGRHRSRTTSSPFACCPDAGWPSIRRRHRRAAGRHRR
jgi:beta-N-acetylhexosaminidase